MREACPSKGARACLHSLANAASRNGECGTLKDFHPESGRWVFVPDRRPLDHADGNAPPSPIRVKASNLYTDYIEVFGPIGSYPTVEIFPPSFINGVDSDIDDVANELREHVAFGGYGGRLSQLWVTLRAVSATMGGCLQCWVHEKGVRRNPKVPDNSALLFLERPSGVPRCFSKSELLGSLAQETRLIGVNVVDKTDFLVASAEKLLEMGGVPSSPAWRSLCFFRAAALFVELITERSPADELWLVFRTEESSAAFNHLDAYVGDFNGVGQCFGTENLGHLPTDEETATAGALCWLNQNPRPTLVNNNMGSPFVVGLIRGHVAVGLATDDLGRARRRLLSVVAEGEAECCICLEDLFEVASGPDARGVVSLPCACNMRVHAACFKDVTPQRCPQCSAAVHFGYYPKGNHDWMAYSKPNA